LLITNQTSGLKTYENLLYGFAFDFPIDWQIDMPTGVVQDEVMGVLSAESASMPPGTFGARTGLKVNVNKVTTYLDPESLQVKALTARDYANSWLDTLSPSSGGSLFTYDIVNTTPTVLANESNAWRQEYITNIEGKGQSIFNSEVYVVKDGLVYELSFHTNPLSVPETLPIGKKIMESFRFI
jgi:hypothetical protein